jgi:mono/diheme cytochrome c family protein
MTSEASSVSAVPWLAGVGTGVLSWVGLSLWFVQPLIPTTDDLPTVLKEPPPSAAPAVAAPAGPTDPGEQVFTTVCAACHQANGKGLPGAFPPLAGSEWVTADPETPIRVVIAGLSGPIKVNGGDFNSMMPPPPGVSTDDEKIAAVLSYVRTNFDNKASKITKEEVSAVRASMAGKTSAYTADELTKLRPKGGAAPAGDAPAGAAPAAAPAGTAPAAPTGAAPAAPTGAAPTTP